MVNAKLTFYVLKVPLLLNSFFSVPEAAVAVLHNDVLPFYAGNLPYYQRLNANALSRSVRAAMTLGDQRTIPTREWRLALPAAGGRALLGQD